MIELIWDNKDKMLEEVNSDGFLKTNKYFEYYKEESKNFNTTENLYIEGDNLDALKLLQKDYNNKIKMIYIDPPYNTEKKFIYNDTFRNKRKKECRHSGWLNMMYPRLMLARNLLTDNGAIFISIDDNEIGNLKKICDEIYGEENLISIIPWQARQSIQNDTDLSSSHEYIVAYAKRRRVEHRRLKESNEDKWYELKSFACYPLPLDKNKFYNPDNDLRGLWKADPFDAPNIRPNLTYPIVNPNTNDEFLPPEGRCWRTDEDSYKKLLEDNRIVFGKSGKSKPQLKVFYDEKKKFGSVDNTWFTGDKCGTATQGTKELQKLFNGKAYFDTPKPTKLIIKLLQLCFGEKSEGIVLDFFSGSGTTADAVMKYNSLTGSICKCISIQIPECTNDKSVAKKEGYKNICEIGKERIRRAGDKIVKENKDKDGIEDLDIGFKVIKIK